MISHHDAVSIDISRLMRIPEHVRNDDSFDFCAQHLELMDRPLDALSGIILSHQDENILISAMICIICGHPEASTKALQQTARDLNISESILAKAAAIIRNDASIQAPIPKASSYPRIASSMKSVSGSASSVPKTASSELPINERDANGNTRLHRTILERLQINIHPKESYYRVKTEIMRLLIEGADPAIPNLSGDTVLHLLAELPYGCYGDTSLITALVKYGATANVPNYLGITPLHCLAASIPYGDATEILIIQGKGDVNAQDKHGNTPLHHVAGKVHYEGGGFFEIEVANVLLAHGAAVNIQNNDGDSPFHIGIREYRSLKKVIKFFIHNAHADLNLPNNAGDTPFLLLAGFNKWDKYDHKEAVVTCLEHGADKTIKNKKGESPLDRARYRRDSDVLDLLEIPTDLDATETIESVSATRFTPIL